MTNTDIPREIVTIALDNVSGDDFENFANQFFAALEGHDFKPLGGIHDGGADGFKESSILESNQTDNFYQFSKEQNHREKYEKQWCGLTNSAEILKL